MEEEFDIVKAVAALFIIGLLIGGCILGWVYILGPLFNQADYNNFNTSQQHLNAVAQKFSDDCRQLAETTDPVAKKGIENDIYSNASTVDLNKIVLPPDVRTCVSMAIDHVTHP